MVRKFRYFRNLMRIICVSVCVFCVFIGSAVSSNNLPSEYTELEYIESTGTQYIDTGTSPKDLATPILEAQLQYLADPGDYNYAGFGTYSGGYWFKFDVKHSNEVGLQSGKASSETILDCNIFEKNVFKIDPSNAKCYLNGAEHSVYVSNEVFDISNNFTLFKVNGINNSWATAQCYNFKIYDDSILVRNFVPAKRNSDSVIGMYDTVTNTFFTNSGTGKFIAGPVLEIKIATTKYVETAFAESVSELNSTIGTIKNVVDNTIIQADRIGKLHTGKQTRPDEQCPKGRECLLITEADGSLHWYPICDANGSVDPIE